MKLTVHRGSGAWPPAGEGCSGFAVEHAGPISFAVPGLVVDFAETSSLPRIDRRRHQRHVL